MSEESSTHNGAEARRELALTIFGQRSSLTRPLRSSSPFTPACEAMKRCASSGSDISRLKSATGLPKLIAAFSAMQVTSEDLPIEGRAAMTIRLPGWKPPVIPSRSAKPEGVPVSEVPARERSWSLSSSWWSTEEIERKSCWLSSWATSSTSRSARSQTSRAGARLSSTLDWIS